MPPQVFSLQTAVLPAHLPYGDRSTDRSHYKEEEEAVCNEKTCGVSDIREHVAC